MKKILITGGAGFLGSHLVESLKSKYQIYLIIKNSKKIIKNENNIKKIYFKKYSDLNLKLRKLKVDIVIHCATHYKKDHKYEDIEKIISSNILFGNILLENLVLTQEFFLCVSRASKVLVSEAIFHRLELFLKESQFSSYFLCLRDLHFIFFGTQIQRFGYSLYLYE